MRVHKRAQVDAGGSSRPRINAMSTIDPFISEILVADDGHGHAETGSGDFPDYPGETPPPAATRKWCESWTTGLTKKGYGALLRGQPMYNTVKLIDRPLITASRTATEAQKDAIALKNEEIAFQNQQTKLERDSIEHEALNRVAALIDAALTAKAPILLDTRLRGLVWQVAEGRGVRLRIVRASDAACVFASQLSVPSAPFRSEGGVSRNALWACPCDVARVTCQQRFYPKGPCSAIATKRAGLSARAQART